MTRDPLTGPFMAATRITDSSNDEGMAPSRARQLREEAMN